MTDENEDLENEAAATSANQSNESTSGPEIIDGTDNVPVPCNVRSDLIQYESHHVKDRPGIESMDCAIDSPIPASQNDVFVQHERDASAMKLKHIQTAAGATESSTGAEDHETNPPGIESMDHCSIDSPIPVSQNNFFLQHESDSSAMKAKLNNASAATVINTDTAESSIGTEAATATTTTTTTTVVNTDTTESSIRTDGQEMDPAFEHATNTSTEQIPIINNEVINSTVLTAETSPLTGAYSHSSTGDIIIPEATLVPDHDTIPTASVVYPERNSFTIMGKKISPAFMVAMFVLVLIIVISLSVVLTQRNTGVNAPSYAPSMSLYPPSTPSIEPSSSPTSVVYGELLSIITEKTGLNESSFSDTKSTKRSALDWLAEDLQASRSLNGSSYFTYSDAEIYERFTMALLYYDTRGDGWFDSFQFLTPDHVCKWRAKRGLLKKGVIKCTQDNRITELALFDNNLKGVLPSEVSLLSELTVLDVGINDLSSPLPRLENLTNLTKVDIKSNDFDGFMPRFEKLTRLQTLDFSNNEFEGTLFDADNLTELKTFKISGNALTGEVPPSYQSLGLETFHIQQNKLSGSVDFLCSNLPTDFDLDCFDDVPELRCNCCIGCTFVSVECNPDNEATAIINITEASEGFTWRVSRSSNWTFDPLFAGGLYEAGESIVIEMCLPTPGDYVLFTEFNGTEQLGYFSIGRTAIPLQDKWGYGQWSEFSIDSDGSTFNVPTSFPTSSPVTIIPTITLQPTPYSTPADTPSVGTNKTLWPTAMFTRPPSETNFPTIEGSTENWSNAASCLNFNIKLTTDAFGEETSYSIYKKDNTPVVSHTSFESNSTYDQYECLDPNECYRFTILILSMTAFVATREKVITPYH